MLDPTGDAGRKSWDYIEREGLDKVANFRNHADHAGIPSDSVSGTLAIPFPPDPDDLVRLHRLVRERMCFTVLEFGIGYSTLIIADALRKNEVLWNGLKPQPKIRNRFMFQVFSVDTSEHWINATRTRLPQDLATRVHFLHSGCVIGTHEGQMCHYYRKLPDIVPDFVYLDGPAPKDVEGQLNGLTFQCDERTVMAADLLLMEPTLLPGTFVLVDGRTNNARFLERSFKRKWETRWDRTGDVTTFELIEERLGKYNVLGPDFLPGRS